MILEGVRFFDHLVRRRQLTRRKLGNIIGNYRAFRAGTPPPGSPPILLVDPAAACQLRCTGCATGRDPEAFTAMMSLDQFTSLMNPVVDTTLVVGLYRQGEPFLNPHLVDMIEFLTRQGVSSFTSTNCELIGDDDALERLVRSGLFLMIASVSGTTPGEHRRYHRGGSLETVIDNLRRLSAVKRRLNSLTPYVHLRYLGTDPLPSPRELGAFQRRCEADSIRAVVRRPLIGPRHAPLEKNDTPPSGGSCRWPWMASVISADGQVSQCCQSPSSLAYDMGNALAPGGLPAVWAGSPYRDLRTRMHRGRESLEACRGCPATLGLT